MAKQMTFDGGALDYLFVRLLSWIITGVTFGLGLPWGLTIMSRWRAEHTLINGQRMTFVGTGFGLFGSYIKWWFFMIITFGIYGFWLIPAIVRWEVENTRVASFQAK